MIRSAGLGDAAAIRRVAKRAYQIYVQDLGRPPAPMVADFEHHTEHDRVIVWDEDWHHMRLCRPHHRRSSSPS